MTDFSNRDAAAGVAAEFVERWSPRAFEPADMPAADLTAIIDAARWSPSCYNEQPWTLVTATRDKFEQVLPLLVEANQSWAKNAAVIGFIIAERQFQKNGNDNYHADFDCGSAWMALSLQARKLGYYSHGMGGIDYAQIYQQFGLDPERQRVLAAFALGKIGDPAQLSDAQRAMEQPSARKPLRDIWRQV